MNCKKCNALVPDDSAFCPECGEKVEVAVTTPSEPAAQVFCPECGAPMAANDSFCENCGAKVEPAAAAKNRFAGLLGKADAGLTAVSKKINVPAKYLKLGLAAVALILVVAIVVSIFSGLSAKNNYALYIKDGELYYAEMPKGKPVEVSEDGGSYSARLSKNGKNLFYLDDYDSDDSTYTLFYRNITKEKSEPVKLDSGIKSYNWTLSENGKTVVYIKNDNLYTHNLKENKKIASDVEDFYCSADCKTIWYLADYEENEEEDEDGYITYEVSYTLYKYNGKDSTEVDEGEINICGISKDGDDILYELDGDLYLKKGKKDKEKLASNAEACIMYEDGSFYYTVAGDEISAWDIIEDDVKDNTDYDYLRDYLKEQTDDSPVGNLYYYNGKESKLVAEGIVTDSDDFSYETAVIAYNAVEGGELPTMKLSDYANDSYSAMEEWRDELTEMTKLYIAVKDNASVVDLEEVSDVSISSDGKTAYALTEVDDEEYVGTLHKITLSGKKIKKTEKIDTDVSYGYNGFVGNYYVYFKDVKDYEGDMYIDGKEVDTDVYVYGCDYCEETNTMIYYVDYNESKDQGTLKQYKKGKVTKIQDDVHEAVFTPEGEILYLYDYSKGEGELFVWTGKKAAKLDDEVSDILYVYQ